MNMRTSKAVVTVLLSTLFPSVYYCNLQCRTPAPGRCSSDNTSAWGDEVCTITAANCAFEDIRSLCFYKQGCRDPNMSNWTINDYAAQAHQTSIGDCSAEFYYSVLETPWLNITQNSSLQFEYSRSQPAALDVFVEFHEGYVIHVFNRTENNGMPTLSRDVPSGTAKVIFRAYGGGAGTNAVVKVKEVSITAGTSTLTECDFGTSSGHMCGWDSHGWNTTTSNFTSPNSTAAGYVARVVLENMTPATLTSPLVSPTSKGQTKVDCLSFHYRITESSARINVSVLLLGEETSTTVWSESQPDSAVSMGQSQSQQQSAVIVGKTKFQVRAPYKIIFTGEKSQNSTEVVLDNLRLLRNVASNDCPLPHGPNQGVFELKAEVRCVPAPPHSSTITTNVETTTAAGSDDHSTPPGRITSSPTDSSSFPSHMPHDPGEVTPQPTEAGIGGDDDGADGAVIGGAVSAVIVVIVIVVVIVIIFKRRHSTRSHSKNAGEVSDTNKSTRTERRGETMNNEVYGMENSTMTSSISPYEFAEDGAPGKTRTAPGRGPEDDYNRKPTTKPQQPTAPALVDVSDNGDCCSTTNGHSGAEADVSAMYTQVQKKLKKAAGQPAGPGDAVYSQVNKKGKKITTAENQPDPAAVYSQVNKKGNNSAGHYDVHPAFNKKPGKPVIAPKPKQGKQPTGPAKNQVPGDTTGVDPYDTIDTVPSPGRPQPVSTEGAVETDDYNALDFDEVRRVKTETEEVEETAGPYNFLYNDPSEGYSTAGEARKKVVIGSDYDHVQM